MSTLEIKRSGKFETLLIAAILLAITIVTSYYKELFVAESGNIKIFGNLGFLLVIALLLKWKYTRTLVSYMTIIAIVGILMTMTLTKSITLPFLLLLAGLSISFYLSSFSEGVKAYLNGNRK